jgi:fatty-acyl-CoA synthase
MDPQIRAAGAEDAAQARGAGLSLSYWRPDASEPVLEITVGDALRSAAATWPDRVALVEGLSQPAERRRWTFASLLADAERIAQALLARFKPGDHVAVWAPNSPEWVLLEFGAALAGLTLVTVNPAYLAAELRYVLRQSRAVGLFLAAEYRGRSLVAVVEEIRSDLPLLHDVVTLTVWPDFVASGNPAQGLPPVHPDDVVQIQYTSGTTGFPKGAMLHHRGLTNNGRLFAQRIRVAPTDVWINPVPLFHTAGCVLITLGALQAGATHVLMPAFDPSLMLGLIETERSTIVAAVPTMLIALLEHPDFTERDLSSVRLVYTGGAPVPVDLMRRVEAAFGVRVGIGYGQTESSPYITHTYLDDADADRLGSVGTPLPHTEVKIVDPKTDSTVPHDTIGEICTRGYLVMRGYFDNVDATAAAIDSEGWLHTGDLGTMDARGYCRVEGRLKDMIIRGGENIYPREIEAVLFAHPMIADVAVVGIPDERWGETVAAFVRLAPEQEVTEQELAAYCREHLAPYKTPRLWRFVERFPQTASGKIQKFVLRDQLIFEASAGG